MSSVKHFKNIFAKQQNCKLIDYNDIIRFIFAVTALYIGRLDL